MGHGFRLAPRSRPCHERPDRRAGSKPLERGAARDRLRRGSRLARSGVQWTLLNASDKLSSKRPASRRRRPRCRYPNGPTSIACWGRASLPLPGQWRTDVAPFLREIQDCLSPDSGIERTIFMKPVQCGATEILLNVAAYYLVHCPSTVLIVQPNESMVKRLSRQRIEPLIELCAPLRALVAKARSTGGNEVALKTTRNGGVLAIASAQSAAALGLAGAGCASGRNRRLPCRPWRRQSPMLSPARGHNFQDPCAGSSPSVHLPKPACR